MERLPIIINGVEKYASGISKDTTVDDIKFAMLSATYSNFTPDMLDNYGVFEHFQSVERLLDGRVKMYKIIRSYNYLPGDLFSQIKFVIKKKIQINKISKEAAIKKMNNEPNKAFKFCSLSPVVQKTWNEQILNRKSSFVKKQLENVFNSNEDAVSINSIPSSAWSSDCDEENNEKMQIKKRYATIKQLNRMRNCVIKKTSDTKLTENLNRLDQLKSELNNIEKELNIKKSNVLKKDLKNIDDMMSLKTKLIHSLEQELNQIEQSDFSKKSLSSTSSASSIKSTDSGISSCHSEDEFLTTTQLVTLV